MLKSGSKCLKGVKGVGSPKYGVQLDAPGRAMGRHGWKLGSACNSNAESYLGAEGDRKGISLGWVWGIWLVGPLGMVGLYS